MNGMPPFGYCELNVLDKEQRWAAVGLVADEWCVDADERGDILGLSES